MEMKMEAYQYTPIKTMYIVRRYDGEEIFTNQTEVWCHTLQDATNFMIDKQIEALYNAPPPRIERFKGYRGRHKQY